MPPHLNEDDQVWAGLYALSLDDDHDEDSPSPQQLSIPLQGVQVHAQVVDFIAEIKLQQTYHNKSEKSVEAIYHFPLDHNAAVCGFQAAYSDGRSVQGVVQEKEEARNTYQEAKQAGKQANLLESVRRDVFTLCVGNLPANGKVTITITYVTTLEARQDVAALVLPTYIAPRYSPTSESLTPLEAQALAPPSQEASSPFVQLYGLDIDMNVKCKSPIKNITSQTHHSDLVVQATNDPKTSRVTMKNVMMDRDIVVLVEEEDCHQPRATVEVAEDGTLTGLLTFYPRLEFAEDATREFIFVVDQSGSMRGSKMQQARQALLLLLRALPAGCRFNIVSFGSHYRAFQNEPQPYNDNTLELATNFAHAMEANMGGTEILKPLQYILGQPCESTRQVFVLTDGQISNDSAVFDLIRNSNARLFSVGIGTGVSRHLVSGMARAGRGTARFVEQGDSLQAKLLGQLKQALQPSFEDVSIEWKFPDQETNQEDKKPSPIKTLLGYRSPSAEQVSLPAPKLYPSVNPPIFNKEKYLSFAMFPSGSPAPTGVTVKCQTSDGPLQVTLDVSPDEVFGGSIARKLAARTAIAEYEDSRKGYSHRHMSSDTTATLSPKEALEIALSNGLVSDQTSFVAVSKEAVVDPSVPVETKVIPQHCPLALHDNSDDEWGHSASRMMLCSAPVEARRSRHSGKLSGMTERRKMKMKKALVGSYATCSLERRAPKGVCVPMTMESQRVASASNRSGSEEQDRRDARMARNVEYAMPMDLCASMTTESLDEHDLSCDLFSASAGSEKSVRKTELMEICLLQKADGSFAWTNELFQVMGLSLAAVTKMHERRELSDLVDSSVFATCLAMVVFRLQFPKKREIWELQHDKAAAFVALHGVKDLDQKLLVLEGDVKRALEA